jgi:hypothetical protein
VGGRVDRRQQDGLNMAFQANVQGDVGGLVVGEDRGGKDDHGGGFVVPSADGVAWMIVVEDFAVCFDFALEICCLVGEVFSFLEEDDVVFLDLGVEVVDGVEFPGDGFLVGRVCVR